MARSSKNASSNWSRRNGLMSRYATHLPLKPWLIILKKDQWSIIHGSDWFSYPFFSLNNFSLEFLAFKQLVGKLFGAIEAGNVSFIVWNQRSLRQYSGDCRFSAPLSAKSGRGTGRRAQFRCDRSTLSVQSKLTILSALVSRAKSYWPTTVSDCDRFFSSPCQNVLFAIGSAFLQHANHFKLYSSFCASHSKAQKVLLPSKTLFTITFPLLIFLSIPFTIQICLCLSFL